MADAIFSDDMDSLTLGCKYMIKTNKKGKTNEFFEINLEKVLNGF